MINFLFDFNVPRGQEFAKRDLTIREMGSIIFTNKKTLGSLGKVEFAELLPPNCPLEGAFHPEEGMKVYRIAVNGTMEDAFIPMVRLKPFCGPVKADPCKSAALSVYRTREQALLEVEGGAFARRPKAAIVEVILSADCGKLAVTDPKGIGHMSWWVGKLVCPDSRGRVIWRRQSA